MACIKVDENGHEVVCMTPYEHEALCRDNKQLRAAAELKAWILKKLRAESWYKPPTDGRSETTEIHGLMHVLCYSKQGHDQWLPETTQIQRTNKYQAETIEKKNERIGELKDQAREQERHIEDLRERAKAWETAAFTKIEKCETCDGEGFMDAVVDYTPEGGELLDAVPCAECDGTGRGTVKAAMDLLRGQIARLIEETKCECGRLLSPGVCPVCDRDE